MFESDTYRKDLDDQANLHPILLLQSQVLELLALLGVRLPEYELHDEAIDSLFNV